MALICYSHTRARLSPGRSLDTVNEVPGSKPIEVDSGLASVEQEFETVEFELAMDVSAETYDEEVMKVQLAEYYGVDASLLTLERVPADHRRKLAHQGFTLRVVITVPDDTYSYEPPDDEEGTPALVDTESGLTVGGTGGGPSAVAVQMAPPPPPRAERLASRLAQINQAEGGAEALSLALGINVTASEAETGLLIKEVTIECPKGHWRVLSESAATRRRPLRAPRPRHLVVHACAGAGDRGLSRSAHNTAGARRPTRSPARPTRTRTSPAPPSSTRVLASRARPCPSRRARRRASRRACAALGTSTRRRSRRWWSASVAPWAPRAQRAA